MRVSDTLHCPSLPHPGAGGDIAQFVLALSWQSRFAGHGEVGEPRQEWLAGLGVSRRNLRQRREGNQNQKRKSQDSHLRNLRNSHRCSSKLTTIRAGTWTTKPCDRVADSLLRWAGWLFHSSPKILPAGGLIQIMNLSRAKPIHPQQVHPAHGQIATVTSIF